MASPPLVWMNPRPNGLRADGAGGVWRAGVTMMESSRVRSTFVNRASSRRDRRDRAENPSTPGAARSSSCGTGSGHRRPQVPRRPTRACPEVSHCARPWSACQVAGWRPRVARGRVVSMVPPTWLDAQGRRHQPLACWTCGREVVPMRFRAADLRRRGCAPPQTRQIPDWCGCSTEYLPVPAGNGWRRSCRSGSPTRRRIRGGAIGRPSRGDAPTTATSRWCRACLDDDSVTLH